MTSSTFEQKKYVWNQHLLQHSYLCITTNGMVDYQNDINDWIYNCLRFSAHESQNKDLYGGAAVLVINN